MFQIVEKHSTVYGCSFFRQGLKDIVLNIALPACDSTENSLFRTHGDLDCCPRSVPIFWKYTGGHSCSLLR